MPERHSVDFDRVGFNVLTDAEARTITLQFENPDGPHGEVPSGMRPILDAIRRRYGAGVVRRLVRWAKKRDNPLAPDVRCEPHPDNPDVLCFRIGVTPGKRMESALTALLDFLRQQPGYRRTLGPPLDRDSLDRRARNEVTVDTPSAAERVLRQLIAHEDSASPNEPPGCEGGS
jgi:hypothetical protein